MIFTDDFSSVYDHLVWYFTLDTTFFQTTNQRTWSESCRWGRNSSIINLHWIFSFRFEDIYPISNHSLVYQKYYKIDSYKKHGTNGEWLRRSGIFNEWSLAMKRIERLFDKINDLLVSISSFRVRGLSPINDISMPMFKHWICSIVDVPLEWD